MKFIKLALLIFLGVFIAIFAANNNQAVELNLYPLPFELEAPFFIAVFIAVLAGVLIGGTTLSIKKTYWRRVANSNKKRAEKLEKKMQESKPTRTDLTV